MARSSQPILSQVIIMALPQAQRHRRQRRHRRLHPYRTGATAPKPARPRAAHQPLRRQHINLQPCNPPQAGSPQLVVQHITSRQPHNERRNSHTPYISRGFTFIRFPFDTSRLRLTGAPTWPRTNVASFFAYACGAYARTTSTLYAHHKHFFVSIL